MSANPSELARLEEEFNYYKAQLRDGIHSKKTKEYLLGKLRNVAKPLGIDVPEYNDSRFSAFIRG